MSIASMDFLDSIVNVHWGDASIYVVVRCYAFVSGDGGGHSAKVTLTSAGEDAGGKILLTVNDEVDVPSGRAYQVPDYYGVNVLQFKKVPEGDAFKLSLSGADVLAAGSSSVSYFCGHFSYSGSYSNFKTEEFPTIVVYSATFTAVSVDPVNGSVVGSGIVATTGVPPAGANPWSLLPPLHFAYDRLCYYDSGGTFHQTGLTCDTPTDGKNYQTWPFQVGYNVYTAKGNVVGNPGIGHFYDQYSFVQPKGSRKGAGKGYNIFRWDGTLVGADSAVGGVPSGTYPFAIRKAPNSIYEIYPSLGAGGIFYGFLYRTKEGGPLIFSTTNMAPGPPIL